MEHPVISLKDIRKSYGSFDLGPVNLEVEPGYIVAVVGPNGSGKSTLFRMLMNLARPDEGSLSLFDSAYPGEEVEIKQKVGYVPERSVGHDEMSAKALGEFVAHWYPTWSQKTYDDLLSRSEIEPDKKFGKLSKGMQRRLAFALAAATGSELLLLDEPTDGVDPFARLEMLEDISAFMQSGDKTVVFATHVMEEVRRIADYVAFLVDGEFLGLYEKDTLMEQWRTFWTDGEPDTNLPGVVEVEGGSPSRVVSDSPEETEDALAKEGIRVVRSGILDLEEILSHLMRRRKNAKEKSVR
ncbi:MAG: ABC transporter ATP-binding protein [Rubrobacter sp.]|nr:ABC transporter ATP-binding protein [Rubrobacter sp.]